jgi:two-component system, OmpR family, response regulator VicR
MTVGMAKKLHSVVVVEDEPALNEAYNIILKSAGYTTASATNGEEALELVSQKDPDLILLDLRMPRMDGNQFLREYDLKKHPKVKVIVFSNYDMEREIDEAYALGAERYIVKALASPKELLKIVKDTLRS